MPRDYKRTNRRKPKAKQAGPFKPFFSGLFLGLIVAFVVYLDAHTSFDLPEISLSSDQAETPTPRVLAEKPKPPTPKFNFYDTLPEMEVVVSEPELPNEAANTRAVKPRSKYILQVASFRKASDAEEMKAKLALLGFEADIEARRFASGVVWHRVKVGPYQSTRKLDRDKRRLQDQGIDVLTVKQSG